MARHNSQNSNIIKELFELTKSWWPVGAVICVLIAIVFGFTLDIALDWAYFIQDSADNVTGILDAIKWRYFALPAALLFFFLIFLYATIKGYLDSKKQHNFLDM